jgi:hypothetical protein
VEHVYDDTLRHMLTAIRGALKSSGRLIIHTPNGDYFIERLRARGVLGQIEGHVAVRNGAAYRHLLETCGFEDVRVRYLPHYLRVAGAFHRLGALPIVGPAFRARLFITARKP